MFGSVDRVWEALLAVSFAALGGLARMLNLKEKRKLKWSMVLSEMFVAGFIGLILYLFVRASGLAGEWAGVICGLGGWVGPKILDLILKPAGKAIGVDMDELNNGR